MLTAVIVLATLGMILIGLEFVLPGGVTGALGAICLCSALICSFFVDSLDTSGRVLLAVAVLVATVVSLFAWLKVFSSEAFTRRFGLSSAAGVTGVAERYSALIGLQGSAKTTLRPAGKAIIDGKSYDVTAETGLIERGEPVKVVKTDGMRLIVRRITTEIPT